jgi:Relaxase/Mobilisation nuclease domain
MLPNITRGHTFDRLNEYLTELEKKKTFGPMADYLTRPKEGKTERVGFVELINFLPGEASTPQEAARVMGLTAANAAQLKRSAGVAPTGNKATAAPVWHLSLSWTHGEKPDKAEKMRAADSALRAVSLGFKKGYQVAIVEHVDTEHPHIHIVVNLVHPITGKQANPWKDRERLQVWAHRYDRQRGNTFCEYRAWKYEDHAPEKKPAREKATKDVAERAALKVAKQFNWAMNEAAAIRAAFSEKATAISNQNRGEIEARAAAKQDLWQEYEQKRAEIKARFDEQVRDHYRHRKYKEARGRQPKGPTHLKQSPEWRGLNRRLRTAKAEFYKREMAPLKKGDRAWRFNQAVNDNTIKEREKVARAAVEHAVSRRNKIAPLRTAMNVELAALSVAYTFQSQQLKVREAVEKLAARARWRELSKERVETWDKFRIKHKLQEKENLSNTPQKDLRGPSGINRLSPDFARAVERADPDKLRWDEKTAEFRKASEEIAGRLKEMDAGHEVNVSQRADDFKPKTAAEEIRERLAELDAGRDFQLAQNSEESGSKSAAAEINQRLSELDAGREQHSNQGWKLRGKDRAPRNRGGGGREHE